MMFRKSQHQGGMSASRCSTDGFDANAFGRLQNSVGYDPIATRPDETDVASLKEAWQRTLKNF